MTRFQKLAAATVVTAILLVTIGVIVRVTGSGLGCPDWPLCQGQIIPPLNDAQWEETFGKYRQTPEFRLRNHDMTLAGFRESWFYSDSLNDLPLLVNGAVRSPFDLATITPEVAGSGDSNLRIGGGRIGAFGVTLDGTDVKEPRYNRMTLTPSLDAIEEFKVQTAAYSAEYGF